jgi:carbamoyl-phosphate synthase large subunit
MGQNFAAEATRRMLGVGGATVNNGLDLDYVGVKVPMFSFSRLVGVDPILGVEMASTGEVGCLGTDLHEALLHGLLATGFRMPSRGVLLSLGPLEDKYWFADEARVIAEDLQLPIYATRGTADMLMELGIACTEVEKKPDSGLTAMELIDNGVVDLVINIPREYDHLGRPDGYFIRRHAVDSGVPLITDLQLARALVEAMRCRRPEELRITAWQDLVRTGQSERGATPIG